MCLMRRNGINVRKRKFMLSIRKSLLTTRSFRLWNNLSRKSVEVPQLGLFKSRMGKTLANLLPVRAWGWITCPDRYFHLSAMQRPRILTASKDRAEARR